MPRILSLLALLLSLPVLGSEIIEQKNNNKTNYIPGLSDYSIDLENPLALFGDANTMFLFTSRDQASGRILAPNIPKINHIFAKGILGYGSQNSSKISAGIGIPVGKYS